MVQVYIVFFLISFILSLACTRFLIYLVPRLGIVDKPDGVRKIHKKSIPLLGGVALYITFVVVLLLLYYVRPDIFVNISFNQIIGIVIAGFVLMIGGIIDDKYNIGHYSFIFPLIATVVVFCSGVFIQKITNPLGGIIDFVDMTFFSGVLTFCWLLGMTYTTKLLDGLDGLVTGLTSIATFIIFLLSISERFFQPDVALVALVFTGAFMGFLVFNFNPARIFLGEGGSVLTGFILAVLAIISGSKIATALLIMGIPILDVVWIILRRFKSKASVKKHDALHLHHRFLAIGLTQRQVVLFYYSISFMFGITTLFLQSLDKIFVLFILVIFMVLLGWMVILLNNRDKEI